MQNSEAGDRIRAAGEALNVAMTELSAASEATDDDAVNALLDANAEVMSDQKDVLFQLANNADVAEIGDADDE